MKLTKIKEKVFNLVGDEFLIFDERENVNTHDKIKFFHKTCGNIIEISPNKFIDCGKRCKYCSGKAKKTPDEIRKLIEDSVGTEYEIISTIEKFESEISLKHVSGEIIITTPKMFLKGYNRAKEDSFIKKKKTDKFKEKVQNLVGDEYTVLGEFKSNREKILIRHNSCGTEYKTTPDNFISGKRCRKCCFSKFKKTPEEFKDQVSKITSGEYEVISEYISSKDFAEFKHKDHTFKMRPNDFLNGHRCPICNGKGKSQPEIDIYNFLIDNGFTVEKKKMYERKYEIDLFIPEWNIGIEYDGLYWHSDIYKDKNYHLDKMNYFKEKGIRIINIFEDEWLNKTEIVKNKLLHILGKDSSERIFGRKCTVRKIDTKTKNEFLNKYHLQGADKSKINIGLFYNDELVSVMTFGKGRISLGNKSSNIFELVRFANSKNVIGGFGKLLKYAINEFKIENIITYADLRWSSSENNIYEKNNFILSGVSLPNYWYCKDNVRYHRFGFRKSVLKDKFPDIFDESLSEIEIMNKSKYYRVYDCGNLVYKMTIKKEIS